MKTQKRQRHKQREEEKMADIEIAMERNTTGKIINSSVKHTAGRDTSSSENTIQADTHIVVETVLKTQCMQKHKPYQKHSTGRRTNFSENTIPSMT